MKILVTGANSGLGRYCCEYFNGVPMTRQSNWADIFTSAQTRPFDAIIHAAYNSKFSVIDGELYSYLQDTLLLTQRLLTLPHKKFIFVSTADVYPKTSNHYQESDVLNIKDLQSIYAISKLLCENLVINEGNNVLILRPTALLGVYARPNSLVRILAQENPQLTLSAQSTFNYIRHADVASFIARALANDLTGIYNLTAAANISLAEVAQTFKRQVIFGDYTYTTGSLVNTKAASVLSQLNNTSLENIKLFLQEPDLPFAVAV